MNKIDLTYVHTQQKLEFDSSKHVMKDGIIHCKVCGEPLEVKYDNGKTFNCVCSCYEKQKQMEEENERKQQLINKIDELRKKSLLGKRFANASFNNISKEHNKNYLEACGRCLNYCNKSQEMLANGYGMYIYGSCGGGKTYLTACMINELTNKLHTVICTNFNEISRELRNSYANNSDINENEIINEIKNVDFLFIDDFGTEIVKKYGEDSWLQEKMYDIINSRYNDLKPVIFSSNYSIEELKQRGLMDKTVDRISEMATAIFHIQEKNFRKKGKEIF